MAMIGSEKDMAMKMKFLMGLLTSTCLTLGAVSGAQAADN
jgi:hypothetical protein